MPGATVTSKGQITIPQPVRAALDLKPGDRIVFVVRDDGIAEMRPETLDLLSLCGAIRPKRKGISLDDMEAAIRKGGTRR